MQVHLVWLCLPVNPCALSVATVCAFAGLRAAFSDSEADAAGHTTDGETILTHALVHCISGVSSGATAAGASPTTAAESNGGCESLDYCDAPQMCTAAQQRKTINVLKHMSAEDIIRHWKHFLHDVSAELLQAEQEEQHDKLRKLQQYGKDVDDDSTCTSAHESVGKICRYVLLKARLPPICVLAYAKHRS